MASQELNQALWNAANVMRSTMSADEYKDYLLGMIFYKYQMTRFEHGAVALGITPEELVETQSEAPENVEVSA